VLKLEQEPVVQEIETVPVPPTAVVEVPTTIASPDVTDIPKETEQDVVDADWQSATSACISEAANECGITFGIYFEICGATFWMYGIETERTEIISSAKSRPRISRCLPFRVFSFT